MAQSTKHPFRLDWSGVLILLVALAMPAIVYFLIAGSPTAPIAVGHPAPPPPPTAEVLKATRELKLITMRIDSRVKATNIDEKWRGTAKATIEAPVRYHFGVDLSKLSDNSLTWNPINNTQTLTIPPPALLAIEVDGSHPISERVDVTGTRFKKLSGAEQLNLAQKSLYEVARQQVLPKSELDKIRASTRNQIEAALGPFASSRIEIRFSDE